MHRLGMVHKDTGAAMETRGTVQARRVMWRKRMRTGGQAWILGSQLPAPSPPLPGRAPSTQGMGRAQRQATAKAMTQGMGRPQRARSAVLMLMEEARARYKAISHFLAPAACARPDASVLHLVCHTA